MFLEKDAIKTPVNRRSFLKNAGITSAAVAGLGLAAAPKRLFAETTSTPMPADTPTQIFTAALVAEDLAITFYYNGLVGKVIQDPNLAGPGGTAVNVSNSGSPTNVGYLRAALHQEIAHAQLFRTLLGFANPLSNPAGDPYTKFYIPTGSFDSIYPFIGLLEALENAFIAAYLAAVQEFSLLAAQGTPLTLGGTTYQPATLAYYAQVAASILGIESEHRALGRAIPPDFIPANNLNYEQQNGIFTVYNGTTSAVAALTPFLTPGSGKTEYDFVPAYNNAHTVTASSTGTIPSDYFTS